MPGIVLGKGYLDIVDGDKQFRAWTHANSRGLPSAPKDGLPSIEDIYQYMRDRGTFSDEFIIRQLLKHYHKHRIFKGGYLKDVSICIGFFGSRGAGKTCGAVGLSILDFLLAGIPVWSNLKIEVDVRYRDCQHTFSTIDLEKVDVLSLQNEFSNGLLLLEEVNIEFSEARRSMSKRALAFSYALQLLRKKKLNLIYTTQNDGWIDERLRWQTDFSIGCRDAFFSQESKAVGERSIWKIYDNSGLVMGETPRLRFDYQIDELIIGEITFWNKPFWTCYDSYEIYGLPDGIKSDDIQLPNANIKVGETPFLRDEKQKRNDAKLPEALDLCVAIRASGQNTVDKDWLWQQLGLSGDISKQTSLGTYLVQEYNFEPYRYGGRYYYKLPALQPVKGE